MDRCAVFAVQDEHPARLADLCERRDDRRDAPHNLARLHSESGRADAGGRLLLQAHAAADEFHRADDASGADDQAGLLAPLSGAKPKPSKPASVNKKDVIAFVRQSFDPSIAIRFDADTGTDRTDLPGLRGSMTGLEVLMLVLDHTTHHRASAEMYLRARGNTPAEFQF
jgi:DinB family